MAQQVLLANTEGLVGEDLGQAYNAVKAGRDVSAGMTVRWDDLSSCNYIFQLLIGLRRRRISER